MILVGDGVCSYIQITLPKCTYKQAAHLSLFLPALGAVVSCQAHFPFPSWGAC